jgi:hypothetical protein
MVVYQCFGCSASFVHPDDEDCGTGSTDGTGGTGGTSEKCRHLVEAGWKASGRVCTPSLTGDLAPKLTYFRAAAGSAQSALCAADPTHRLRLRSERDKRERRRLRIMDRPHRRWRIRLEIEGDSWDLAGKAFAKALHLLMTVHAPSIEQEGKPLHSTMELEGSGFALEASVDRKMTPSVYAEMKQAWQAFRESI